MEHPLSNTITEHLNRIEEGDYINIESNWFSYDITYDESVLFEDNYMTVYSKEVKGRDIISTFNLDHITLVRFVKNKGEKYDTDSTKS